MSSEHLASAKNHLKGDLGGSWNIFDGASAQYTDLGIARRFGGAAAAYSLRDIGAINGRVVQVRRSSDGDERDFSAGAIASGGLESYATETVNMYTSNFATTDGFSDNRGTVASVDGIGGKDDVLRFTLDTVASSFHMIFKNIATSDETVRVQGEIYIPSSNNKVDSVAIFIDGGGNTTQIGSTLVPTADQWVAFDVTGQVSGTKIHFRAKDGGTFSIEDTGGDDVFYLANVTVNATQSSGYVKTWYDQSGNGRNVTQTDGDTQPKIIENGSVFTLNSKPAISFAGDGVRLSTTRFITTQGNTAFLVYDVTSSLYPSDAGTVIRQGANYRISFGVLGGSNAGKIQSKLRDNGGDTAVANSTSSSDGQTILQTSIFSATRGADGIKTFINSTNEFSGDTTDIQDVDFTSVENPDSTNNALYIGSNNLGNFDFLGNLGEIILFNTDKTSDRTNIENDINNHYSIY